MSRVKKLNDGKYELTEEVKESFDMSRLDERIASLQAQLAHLQSVKSDAEKL